MDQAELSISDHLATYRYPFAIRGDPRFEPTTLFFGQPGVFFGGATGWSQVTSEKTSRWQLMEWRIKGILATPPKATPPKK